MPGIDVYDENAVDTAYETASDTYSSECLLTVEPLPPPVNQPQVVATSVSADGTSATFPYPTLSDGSPLPAGYYQFVAYNQSSPATFHAVGVGMFAVGSNDTSHTTPFGVDGANVTVSSRFCYVIPPGRRYCTDGGTSTSPQPILTLSSPGQVYFNGSSVTVGSEPVAVKAYAVTTYTTYPDPYGGYVRRTQPSRAIAANLNSNTVSIVDLHNYVVVQTIVVGTKPTSLVLKNDETKAYVANYGSASVSEIDLGSNTQTRVAGVGSQPEALTMDPSGSAVWIGGRE